jgi:nitrogen fixation/metabolism regulation signal transduction histidine kinase
MKSGKLNQEILAGLKNSMSRGESLKDAMMSFYNAGYPRQEIEEAARAVQLDMAAQTSTQTSNQASQQVQNSTNRTNPLPVQKQIPKVISKPLQKISAYPQLKTKKSIFQSTWFVLLLLIILLVLVGVLVSLFLYKDFFIDLFTNVSGAPPLE